MDYSAGGGAGGGGGGAWTPQGVFWRGADGNVWVKGAQGTNSAKQWDANSEKYWTGLGYGQIDDPAQSAGHDYGAYDPTTKTWTDTPDPQAAQKAALRSSVYDSKNNLINSAGSQIDQYGTRYGNSVTDYLDSLRTGQQNIDTMGAKNELAKKQGVQGVMGMVGRGIKSTGTMLANKNAGDSSAAGALAGAYGELGQRQMANIGNQYELGNMDIANQQTQFNATSSKQRRDLELGKQEFVTNLLNDVQDKLSQLNAQLADASLPERIAIEQEKEGVRQRANSALQQFDQRLATESQNIGPSSVDARRAQALDMMNKGTDLGAGAFNYTDQVPMQFQGNLPAGSGLPIFTLPRRRMA